MDKQGRTITVKINGQDRPVKEAVPAATDESGGKMNEANRKEVLEEVAAAKEAADDSFDWILPEPVQEEAPKEYKIASKQNKPKGKLAISVWNKKNPRHKNMFSRIFTTVFLAILLGAAFGVTILKLVTSEAPSALPAAVSPAAKENDKLPAGTATAELPAISTFIVQNGVWKTEDAAKARLAMLQEQGVGGEIFSANGQFAIYLSAAGSIEEAKKSAEALKAKGVEVFAKPVELEGRKASGLTEKEAEFIKQAPGIYSIIISGNLEHVKKVEEFSALAAGIADKNIKNKDLQKAKASIERAGEAFIAYHSSKDSGKLAEAQNGLLSFLAAYQATGQ